MIVDTHLHVIEKSRLSYPWLASVPALDQDFSYATYEAEAKRCGITDVLHMEVDVAEGDIGREIDMVSELMGRPGSLVRGAIAACRPESPDFPAMLDGVQRNPTVKGFRRVLHVMPDDLSEGATFRENVARLGGTGLPFDLVVLPHQIPKAIALVDSAPDVQFVLDHCGVPAIAKGEEHPWAEHVTEIARRPNVAAKISGVVAYADPATWTVATLRPYVEHVLRTFGWDRVVWGSDWPVVTLGGALSTWVAATHALLAGCSADERAALLHRNARRIWRLPG
jgi:predicted TIM-barrel fold metal-dependent hydrolase